LLDFFEGVDVGLHRLGLLVEAQFIVELRVIKAFQAVQSAQLRSYLKAPASRGRAQRG
jgi:hypothetical protein